MRNSVKSERLPALFRALADPRRFQMFRLLLKRKDLCVSEIADIFKISVPAASQQLKVLERSGLIRPMRVGQSLCYEVRKSDSLVKSILRIAK